MDNKVGNRTEESARSPFFSFTLLSFFAPNAKIFLNFVQGSCEKSPIKSQDGGPLELQSRGNPIGT